MSSRGRIIEAARTEFARHGYSGASMRTIAAQAGVEVGLVSYYFGTKSKLFMEAFANPCGLGEFGKQLRNFTPEELNSLTEAALHIVLDPECCRELASYLQTVLAPSPTPSDVQLEVSRSIKETLEGVLSAAEDHPGFHLTVAYFVGLFVLRELLCFEPLVSAERATISGYLQRYATWAYHHEALGGASAQTCSATRPEEAPAAAAEANPGREPNPGAQGTRNGQRGRILAVAREQFSQTGYGGTTLRAIATAAGCDVALIPYYFGNKAELFLEAVTAEHPAAGMVQALRERRGTAGVRDWAKLAVADWDGGALAEIASALLRSSSRYSAVNQDLDGGLHVYANRLFQDIFPPIGEPDLDFAWASLGALVLGVYVLRTILQVDVPGALSMDEVANCIARGAQRLLEEERARGLTPVEVDGEAGVAREVTPFE